MGDDYDMTNICGGTSIVGEDFIIKYTPASNMIIDIEVIITNNQNLKRGLFITEGCPDQMACQDFITGGTTLDTIPIRCAS